MIGGAEVRNRAILRSWICPGAGFALVGIPSLAIAAFVASLAIAPAAGWIAFQPTAPALRIALGMIVIASILWLAEQVAVRKATLRRPAPALLDRGFVGVSCIMWLSGAAALALLMTAFGTLGMAGTGMKPTLEESERLIYHKRVDWRSVQPGAIIVYRNSADSAWGRPGWLVISRILAGPGDELSIRDGMYVVNGSAGPMVPKLGRYRAVLDVPSPPESLTIPNDYYFIVPDSPSGGLDSRALSWARAEDIVGTKLWYLSRRGFFHPVR